MFACLITVSEIVVIDLISAATGANSRAFINDISFYSLLIVFSKSLLFFTLKIVSHIINSFKSNEKFDFEFYIYPIVLLIVIVVFVIISYQNDLTTQSHIVMAVSSIILIFVIIVTCILQQQSAKRKSELFRTGIAATACYIREEGTSNFVSFLHSQRQNARIKKKLRSPGVSSR